MKEYMLMGLVLSAIIAIAASLVYSKDYEKVSRLAMSIVLLFALASPVSTLIREVMELHEFDFSIDSTKVEGGYEKVADEAFVSGIVGAIAEEFHLSKSEIAVTLVAFSTKEMRAEKIHVLLSGKAILADTRAIERYLEDSGLGECEVKIYVG